MVDFVNYLIKLMGEGTLGYILTPPYQYTLTKGKMSESCVKIYKINHA